VASRLAEYLGPHTARSAVKTFAQSALHRAPEELRLEDMPRLLDALRPMLRTLVGHAISDDILDALAQELAP
jgi:hypothetical protein